MNLPYTPPFHGEALLAWFRGRAIPGVENVADGVYRRTLLLDGSAACVEVSVGATLSLRVTGGGPGGLEIAADRARRVFDLGTDPAPIHAALGADPTLGPLVAARPGLRVPGAWDPFETAVRGILGQQVSVAAATTLTGRLVARFGEPVALGPGLTHLFPTPAALADVDVAAIGIPRARGMTVQRFAAAVASGELVLEAPLGLDEFVTRLCRLPGIGPWTASYIAMRALAEPDAFPAGDLALQSATGLDGKALAVASEAWRPWRAYAAMWLWDSMRRRAG